MTIREQLKSAMDGALEDWEAGTSLTEAVIKQARSRQFGPDQTDKLVHYANVGAHLRRFHGSDAEDRIIDFEVAEPIKVAQALYGAPVVPLKMAQHGPLTRTTQDAALDYYTAPPFPTRRVKTASVAAGDLFAEELEGKDLSSVSDPTFDWSDPARRSKLRSKVAGVVDRLKEKTLQAGCSYERSLETLAQGVRQEQFDHRKLAADLVGMYGGTGTAIWRDLESHLPPAYSFGDVDGRSTLPESRGVILRGPHTEKMAGAREAHHEMVVSFLAFDQMRGRLRQVPH